MTNLEIFNSSWALRFFLRISIHTEINMAGLIVKLILIDNARDELT